MHQSFAIENVLRTQYNLNKMIEAWRQQPLSWLKSEFNILNSRYFSAALPVPEIALNSRLRSSAGRFIGKRVFGIALGLARIEIAQYLFEREDGDLHIRDTLAHEMIHYWLWIRRRPSGHTREFHQKLNEIGASRYNSVPKPRVPKYIYVCLSCETSISAYRRLKPAACLSCCRQYNHGKYDSRFLLKGRMVR